jgi:hypothetical protein
MLLLRRDFLSGLFVLAIGLFVVAASQNYDFGTLRRIGPGFLPTFFGVVLIVIGLALMVQSLWSAQLIEAVQYRPLIWIPIATIFFAIAAPRIGMVLTGLITVLLAGFSDKTITFKYSLLSGLFLSAGVTLLFWLLNFPIRAWPSL